MREKERLAANREDLRRSDSVRLYVDGEEEYHLMMVGQTTAHRSR